MSYARWAEDSRVYVFVNVGGWLECCGCALADPRGYSARFFTTAAMIEHLDEHVAAGQAVPDYCFEGLREDAAGNDEWIASINKRGFRQSFMKPYGRRFEPTEEHPTGFEYFFTVLGYRAWRT